MAHDHMAYTIYCVFSNKNPGEIDIFKKEGIY